MRRERVIELANIEDQVRTWLIRLDSATVARRLEGTPRGKPPQTGGTLVGDRKGQFSIRINDQFRICFKWKLEGPTDVEITDYH